MAVFLMQTAHSQTARVQIIHNSADAAAAEVDIYVDAGLALDDFAFRTATPYIDLPADTEIEIAVAPSNSTGVGDAIATFPITLTSGETYVVVADGIVSGSGYDPAPAFGLEVYALGREVATDGSNTDLLVHHGSTDAPTVDIVEVEAGAGTIVDNASYTDFAGYLELATADYAIEVQDETGTVTVASYEVPLATLSLDGAAVVAVASGFLDPSVNSDGPAFGVWVALASGGAMVELPASNSRLQVIHNSADLAAAEVDVYIAGALALDDFAFRTATPYIDFPGGVETEIAIAPSTSTGVGDAIATFPVTLTRNETYVVVADGIVSPSGYNPAQPFGLQVFAAGREAAMVGTNTDVLVHHGSTDAPTVDVVETGAGAGIIVDNISYTEFQGYLELPTADYVLQINNDINTVGVAAYSAPLSTLSLDGAAITVVASGFLDPSMNSNGPAFGLWVALASGGALVELPSAQLGVEEFESNGIAIYPNPSSDIINVRGTNEFNYSVAVIDMQGRRLSTSEISNQATSIDINALAPGIYNLIFSEGNRVVGSKRFIKK